MKVYDAKLLGVRLIEPTVYEDSRGFFMESFNSETYRRHGLPYEYVQDNHSLSAAAGVLRGLHYQLEPMAQTKLVRVIAGAIYDVAVDIRPDSPTFGKWAGFILSAENKRQLLIPRGFAHGFCTLVPNTEVLYKVDRLYSQAHDRGIAWNDPELAIDWPTADPLLSDKDAKHPRLADAELDLNGEEETNA